MKHHVFLSGFALLLLGACSPSDSSVTPDASHPSAVAPVASIVLEDAEFNIGIFLDQAENVLKVSDKGYMNVYRLSTPLPSALNQPDTSPALSQWRFEMSDSETGKTMKLTISSSASAEAADGLLDNVPGFSYMRTTEGKGMHHKVARFGHQCVHLAGECGISAEDFASVWSVVLQALELTSVDAEHDQPCALPA